MKVSDFNYELPQELIAQVPIKDRSASRLMVLNKENKTIEDKIFIGTFLLIIRLIIKIQLQDLLCQKYYQLFFLHYFYFLVIQSFIV